MRLILQDYFFDVTLLTDGAPPNDRGCRACGKIGHLVADCPRKKASDNKRKERVKERAKVETGPGEEAQPSEEAQARETPARPRREDTGPAGNDGVGDLQAGKEGQQGRLLATDIRFREGAVKPNRSNAEKTDQILEKQIKNLEEKRKRRGKLGRSDNKLLFDLYKRTRRFEKVDADNSFMVEDGPNGKVKTTRVKLADSKDRIHSFQVNSNEEFDYNSVQATFVKDEEVIDYLTFDLNSVEIVVNTGGENEMNKTLEEENEDFNYNSVERTAVEGQVIDYLNFDFDTVPSDPEVNIIVSSDDEEFETLLRKNSVGSSASSEDAVVGATGVDHRNRNKSLITKKSIEIAKQFSGESSSLNLNKVKMSLKNETRKLKKAEKMRNKKS